MLQGFIRTRHLVPHPSMRAWNRAKLLWGYLARRSLLSAQPVEYIVETTAKCNLYCPMCPRETHKQPKEDMTDEVFNRLVEESGRAAEHMMLIGLGEPFMDAKIFGRIEYCARHNISTLLSTNGTFLDERTSTHLLDSSLEHITLSFDGSTKESFEYYRKGARFEKVRDNFVRFSRMKHERGAKMQVVVQMVRMERNGGEVEDFVRLPLARPGRGPEGTLAAAVIHVDRFGNCVTNITRADLSDEMIASGVSLQVGAHHVRSFRRFYGEGDFVPRAIFAIWGSAGFLESSAAQDSAARLLGIERGAKVIVQSAAFKLQS